MWYIITELKKDAVATDEFIVTDSSNNVVIGLVDGDFTRDLYNPLGSEVSSSIVPIITELGDGKYRVTFTPNSTGNWVLTVYHNTYFPAGKEANYRCIDYRVEDILTDNTGFDGANIDVTISSRASEANATTNTNSLITEINQVAGEVDTELSGTHGSGSWETATTSGVADAVWNAKSANYLSVGSMGRLMKNSGASSFVQKIGQLKGVWTRDEKGILLKEIKNIVERLTSIETYIPKVYETQNDIGAVLSKLDTNVNNSITNVELGISETREYTKAELKEQQKVYLSELELIRNQLNNMKTYINKHNKLVKDALTAEIISTNEETNDKLDEFKQDTQMYIETIKSNIDKLNESNEIKSKEDELRDKLLIKMVPFETLEEIMETDEDEHTKINE